MKRLLALLLMLAGTLSAVPTLVTVSQIMNRADGTPYQGSVYVAWQSFNTAAGEHIPAGSKEVKLSNTGLLSVQLAPNLGASPAGTAYRVTYRLQLGTAQTVSWIVPTMGPVTVTSIESTALVGPSSIISLNQLSSGGASNGQALCFSTVTGLWAPGSCGGGGGGGGAFDSITSGVNAGNTLTVGTGSTLTFTSTGIINANRIFGTAVTAITGTGNTAMFNNSPTILTPTIASFINATHTHTNAAGGGTLAEGALGLSDVITNNSSPTAHGFLPKLTGSNADCFLGDGTFGSCSGGGSGANTALSNLSTVSINTSLLAQTGVDLGSAAHPFRDLFVFGSGTYGTNYFRFTGTPTAVRTVTIPDASGTMTLLGNTANGTGNVVLTTSPTLVTPVLGAATATSINKLTITAPATGSTLTIADGKTLSVNNSVIFAGIDATTITFQGSDTYVGRTTTDTLTNKTLTTPTIGSFVNATHNHTNAANGGLIPFALTSITANALVKGNTTSAAIVTGLTVDSSDNLSVPGSISSGVGSGKSGARGWTGATSGSAWFAARDVAGTAITYYLPSTNGAAGQYLYDSGVISCDANLPATAPAVCHTLAWASATGTLGSVVNSNSPTLVTPVLGAATATSLGVGGALTGSDTGSFWGIFGVYKSSADNFANPASFNKRGKAGDATAAVAINAELGYWAYSGWDSSTYGRGAAILGSSSEAFTTMAHGARLKFYTTPIGSTTNTLQAMLLDNGEFTLGTGDPGNVGLYPNAAATLEVNDGTPGSLGTILVATQSPGDNSTKAASTAYVDIATGGSGGVGSGFTGYSGTITFSGTQYIPYLGSLAASGTEANVQGKLAAAKIQNFYVQLSAAPGMGNSIVFTWRDGGVDQAVTCTISGAVATSCSDTTHTFTSAAGDLGNLKIVTTGSPGALSIVTNSMLGAFSIKGSGTIDFASINDGTCLSSTFTLTGALTSDSVAPGWPSSLNANLSGSMLVSAADTVQVRLCNFSGAAVDPASLTYGASIFR